MPSQAEGTIISILDKVEDLTEEKALDFMMDKVILTLLGPSPIFILAFLLRPIIKKIFNISVKPLMQMMYVNLNAQVALQSGKWTIRKIKKLEKEGKKNEIWDTIITNY